MHTQQEHELSRRGPRLIFPRKDHEEKNYTKKVFSWRHSTDVPERKQKSWRTDLSANAMKDWRNLLLGRSFSRGSLGSIVGFASFRNRSPLSGMPRAWPIVLHLKGSLFLKLICERRGCELEMEKKTTIRTLVCRSEIRISSRASLKTAYGKNY